MCLYCNSLIIIVLHCGFILYHNVIQYTNCWFYFIIVNDSNNNLIIGLYIHNYANDKNEFITLKSFPICSCLLSLQ